MRSWLSPLTFLLLVACNQYDRTPIPSTSTRREEARSSSARQDQGGVDKVEAAPPRAAKETAGASAKPADAGVAARKQSGEAGKRAAAGSGGSMVKSPQMTARDAGAKRAEMDAGKPVEPQAKPDAGPDAAATKPVQNTGSCCSTSTQPGCGNAGLRACVCEREPRCCSEAWDENCTRLVKEKNCQSGVRDCVCGYGEGQWQQAYCCQGGWNDTCESVAYNKCGATADCP